MATPMELLTEFKEWAILLATLIIGYYVGVNRNKIKEVFRQLLIGIDSSISGWDANRSKNKLSKGYYIPIWINYMLLIIILLSPIYVTDNLLYYVILSILALSIGLPFLFFQTEVLKNTFGKPNQKEKPLKESN